MNAGMLWYDASTKITFEQKIENAVLYFHNKYKIIPTTCSMNVKDKEGKPNSVVTSIGTIEIIADRSIIPNHLLIRKEEMSLDK